MSNINYIPWVEKYRPKKMDDLTQDEKCERWVCLECHYIFDPVKGDPKNGIACGTIWKDVPDTWRCPECKILKAKKGVFKRLDD